MPIQVIGPNLGQVSPPNTSKLDYPGGIGLDPATNNLYISDTQHGRVLRMSPAGQILNVAADGHVFHPHGIVVRNSRIYVADPTQNTIEMYSLDLQTHLGTIIMSSGS